MKYSENMPPKCHFCLFGDHHPGSPEQPGEAAEPDTWTCSITGKDVRDFVKAEDCEKFIVFTSQMGTDVLV